MVGTQGGLGLTAVELRLHGEEVDARTRQTKGPGGKPEGVPRCWRRGGAHQGNGRGINSTTATERAADHGGDSRVRT
jgi:hypothetical protein